MQSMFLITPCTTGVQQGFWKLILCHQKYNSVASIPWEKGKYQAITGNTALRKNGKNIK